MTKQTHCQCKACINGNIHDSDCSVHNGDALPEGPCDCRLAALAQLVQETVAIVHIKDGTLVGSHRDGSKPFPDGQYGLWPIATPPLPVQEQLNKADADRKKACADRGKAYAEWSKADAEWSKADAEFNKADADWRKADAEVKRIEELIEEKNT